MSSKKKAVVSERAMIQRINRVLTKDGKKLCRQRGTENYFVADRTRGVVGPDKTLAALAAELGVLETWEELQ